MVPPASARVVAAGKAHCPTDEQRVASFANSPRSLSEVAGALLEKPANARAQRMPPLPPPASPLAPPRLPLGAS